MTLPSGKGPDAFRTISEASAELGVPQHVLRFWETRFAFIRPMKRAGGRRFYRPQDLEVLRGVKALLHDEGYTIKGVQRLHREAGVKRLVAAGLSGEAARAEVGRTLAADEAPSAAVVATEPDEPETRDLFASDDSAATPAGDVSPARPSAESLLAASAVSPPPTERPSRHVLDPGARARLDEVLRDLETTKAAIDALLREGTTA